MAECGSDFAGTFYPRHRPEREAMIDGWTLNAAPHPGRVEGLLLPHAGWVYSGECAMRAIRAASSDRPRRVVHLGPSHREEFEGAVMLDAERLRFGDDSLPVARELGEELHRALPAVRWSVPFPEHSLEVQWPLLAAQWPELPVLPVVLGRNTPASLLELGAALDSIADEGTWWVVSTDLSHFHSHEEADRLDARFERKLVEGDAVDLADALHRRETEACGWAPVLASLEIARRREDRYAVVDRRDSSWASGRYQEVVGYLSALLVAGHGTVA